MTWLGLDVGGTKSRYEWWPEDVHPGGQTRGVQPAVHGVPATIEGLLATIREATRATVPDAAVLALAGAGDARVAGEIAQGLVAAGLPFAVAVIGDVLAAAAAALRDGPGVLLWSGTGSFAVARAENGELMRVGGRGYLLGDQGSGYDFVRRAAAAVLLAVDELGPVTELTRALTDAFDAPSPQRLGAVLQQCDPGAVARRLSVVLDVAARGDAVAGEVLESGAEALAALASAAARSAELDARELPINLGGGVMQQVPAIVELVQARLTQLGFAKATILADGAAARGAAWLAHGNQQNLSPQKEWVRSVAL